MKDKDPWTRKEPPIPKQHGIHPNQIRIVTTEKSSKTIMGFRYQ